MQLPAPRRVLIVVQNLPVPFDRRVWLEATSLRRAGYEVSVICPKAKGFNESYEVLEGIHIHRYPLPFDAGGALGFAADFLWCFLFTALKSVRVALSPGIDVLHGCNPPETYWVLGYFWRLFGKRFLFDHHDLSPEMYQAKFEQPSKRLLAGLRWLERRTFQAADVVITTNESHKRIAVERGGMAPERVFIVSSGPDLARLKRYPADPAMKRGRAQLLVYLGEMCQQDGVDYMLRDRHSEAARADRFLHGVRRRRPASARDPGRASSAWRTTSISPAGSRTRTSAAFCRPRTSRSTRTRRRPGPIRAP
jgi:glycosyltransferase involved in cell wall biosynthesis